MNIIENSDLDLVLKKFNYIPRLINLGTDPVHLTSYLYIPAQHNEQTMYYQIQYKGRILFRVYFNDTGCYFNKFYSFCSLDENLNHAKIEYKAIQDTSLDVCKNFVDEEFLFRMKKEKEFFIKEKLSNIEKDF